MLSTDLDVPPLNSKLLNQQALLLSPTKTVSKVNVVNSYVINKNRVFNVTS